MKFHKPLIERGLPQGSKERELFELAVKRIRKISNGRLDAQTRLKDYELNQTAFIESESDNNPELSSINKLYSKYIQDLISRMSQRSPYYVPLSQNYKKILKYNIKLIAFYLPQFHPIPENDQWWGKGFTDWTNASKAVPQFIGHYQPHLPDELGFYDLRLPEIQKRQIELARQHGIYGFCFHYYWFNGKRLLEMPLEQFINDSTLDFPFCICWANENWTRRWDGQENEVLIGQKHSPENDIKFIEELLPYFRDPRYIKINNRPLFIIYRLPLLPDPNASINRWKYYCRDYGLGEPYIVAAQTFGFKDPREYGADAAVEFPPHTMPGCKYVPKINFINPKFSGEVFDLDGFVNSKGYLERVPYKLFKTVMPSWDNTPRRPNDGTIFYGSTPDNYKKWLGDVVAWTIEAHKPDERIVFINAWNEWGEGAHLEPDRYYGYAYLQSTADVAYEFCDGYYI